MKNRKPRLGQLLRLSAVSGLLAFGSQAMADGTDAGTVIGNTATISYEVNGNAQATIDADAPDFTVDRVVSYTLTENDGLNTSVNPNEQNAVTSFTLTNTSNAPLDFSLSGANLALGSTVNGGTTDAQMGATFEFEVINTTPAGTTNFVDNLAPGASINIDVLADAPIALTNGQIAGITLTVTAQDAGTVAAPVDVGTLNATVLTDSGANTAGVDTVLDSANITASADDGYVVSAAIVAITKDLTLISDPVNGTTAPFAIPGAVVEYTITISNTGAQTASAVSISDQLDAELNFNLDDIPLDPGPGTGTGNVGIEVDGGGETYCEVDAVPGDGCDINGSGLLTIGTPDIPNGSTVVIRFRATIDDTP